MKRKKRNKYNWIKMGGSIVWVLLLGVVIILPPQFIPPVSAWFDTNIRGTVNALYFSLSQAAVILVLGLIGILVIRRTIDRMAQGKHN